MSIRDLFTDPQGFDPKRLLRHLDELDSQLPERIPHAPDISRAVLMRLLERMATVRTRLERLERQLDPVAHHDIYDPSHPESAADLIARKLMEQDAQQLVTLSPFWGSGVYALYYSGAHPAYELISGRSIPIYVGKAEARVARALTAKEQGRTLFDRLREHIKSIRAAEMYADANLDIPWLRPIRVAEFQCRYLVLATAYAGAVEAALIRHWQPVWNKEMKICIGFGKHGDAAETRANTRSDWDTLHPGRSWATRDGNLPNRRLPAAIQADIIRHLEEYPPEHILRG